jgi:pyrroline-5-carboxylate reductase
MGREVACRSHCRRDGRNAGRGLMPSQNSGRFWLIGCGNMGGAMLRGWIESGLLASDFTVIDPMRPAVPDGVRVIDTLPVGEVPDRVLLAVKPQMLDAVAPGLEAALGSNTQLFSILAGVETATLRARFPSVGSIIRVMPNTPAAIRKGVLALYGEQLSATQTEVATALMQRLGHVEWIAAETQFDAVTALSGSGPAFLYRFIDALAEGGAQLGLPADQALRLALATVEGSALLAIAADETPASLAERVASPGGSTREGLNVLDAEGALHRLIAATLTAAEARNAELAQAARG